MTPHTWTVRVRTAAQDRATAITDRDPFPVGPQLDFAPAEGPPTALQLFLGAVAADVLQGYRAAAARRRVPLHDAEIVVTCRLENPLVYLGVVGETGRPAIAALDGTLYVNADADAAALAALWSETLARAPLVATLEPALALSLRWQAI